MQNQEVLNQPSIETKKNFQKSINEIISVSSIQFITSPFRTKRLVIKLVWTSFLIIFFCLSINYCIENLNDYLNFDTITSIQTINEQESDFPTISFCSNFDSSFDIKILHIWFNKQNLIKDWKNYMNEYSDRIFGRCFSFNNRLNWTNHSKPGLRSKQSGFGDGFQIRFYSNTSTDYGQILVSIFNYSRNNPATIFNKANLISAGCDYYFIVQRIFDQKLESPYNDCFKNVSESKLVNETIINYILNKKFEYTHKECFNLCRNLKYQEMFEIDCKCEISTLEDDVFKKCYEFNTNFETKKCVDNFFDYFNENNNEFCSKYCPYECDSFNYDITQRTLPIFAYGNITKTNSFTNNNNGLFKFPEFNTYENVSKTFYSINVYYSDLKYLLIKQQPKIELFGLISNIGGILGLFLSFSFISLLEIFEILAEYFFVYFK